MAQSLFRQLRQQHPTASIDLLAPDWCRALTERMPEIRRSLSMPIGHGKFNLAARYRLGKQLRAENYTCAYVLPNSWKSALVPFFARIKKRIGWRGEWRYGLLTDCRRLNKARYPLMVQRFAALAHDSRWQGQDFLYPKLEVTQAQLQAVLHQFNLTLDKPVLAFAPGAAFGDAKRWPQAYFAKVASHFIAKGWQVWQLGSGDDEAVMQAIEQQTEGSTTILGNRATLADKVDLLSAVTALVSNDSGLMHVGCALEKAVVGIYGSTTPDFTPPLGQRVKILARADVPCRPCFERSCPLKGADNRQCLTKITAEEVINAVETLVNPS